MVGKLKHLVERVRRLGGISNNLVEWMRRLGGIGKNTWWSGWKD